MSARLDPLTAILCALNRRRTLRRLLSKTPWLWRIDRPITDALDRVRRHTLNRLPLGSIGAELGVWKGDFSAEILRVTEPRLLHLVDSWEFSPSCTPYSTTEAGDDVYDAVRLRFQADPRVRIHRLPAQAFLHSCPLESLDWVYLDADHREASVAADLIACWPVLKPHGWLIGDDYYWEDPSGKRTVQTAVDRFCRERFLMCERVGGQFAIQKP